MSNLVYYHAVEADGIAYSVDMLTIRGTHQPEVLSVAYVWPAKISFINGFVIKLRAFCENNGFLDQHYDSFSMLSYRDSWIVKRVSDSATIKFFFGLRTYDKSGLNSWKIQFNPNKLLPCDDLVDLIGWIMARSKNVKISSFDAAADIQIPRSSVFMMKDRRKYRLDFSSQEDKTEYLGVRSDNGFCKLYNKQIESKLPYPLTRFELTVVFDSSGVFSVDRLRQLIPEIYLFDVQATFHNCLISPSDDLLVRFCLEHPDGLSYLGDKKKAKIKALFVSMARRASFDADIWMNLYFYYVQLFNSALLAFREANARGALSKDDGVGVL